MSVDLRKWASSMRDQQSCGFCTCFGINGVWEPEVRLKNNDLGDPIDLSERDLGTCSGTTCSGGNTMPAVLDQAVNGVCVESCCPYDAKDHACGEGRCPNWQVTGKKLDSWKTINSITEMKRLLSSNHPLVGTMMVHQSFMNYVSGVYRSLGIFDPVLGGHCIGIVGYNDEKGAWLLRNSWGTGWGLQGYCWIKYGDSEVDLEMYQLFPSDFPPKPDPNPTPSPCVLGKTVAKVMSFLLWLLHRRGRFIYANLPVER